MGADHDVVIIGAGFAGLYAVHKLRDELGLDVQAFDAGEGPGGTWYWNRYPGARCDFESVHYSYSFSDELQQEWHWTERYASQPEILKYANHVADRFDLRRDIQLGTRVTAAVFDETSRRWTITTDRKDVVSAQFFILATGSHIFRMLNGNRSGSRRHAKLLQSATTSNTQRLRPVTTKNQQRFQPVRHQ